MPVLASGVPSVDDPTEGRRANVDQVGQCRGRGKSRTASQLIAALSANFEHTLEALEKDFKATQGRVRASLDLLPQQCRHCAAARAALKMLAFGEGKSRSQASPEGARRHRLRPDRAGGTRKLNVGLDTSVQALVAGVQKDTDGARTWMARQEISLCEHGHACAGGCEP